MCPEILIIAGDFKFHLDVPTDTETMRFNDLLDTFGLTQHVTVPTHSSGHILDAIITRSSNDVDILLPEATYLVSDHYFMECKMSLPRPEMSVKELKFRKLKQINLETFKKDIAASDLCRSSWSNLDDLAKCYDDTLLCILDKSAPMQKKVIVTRPMVPWFNEDLKLLKSKRRRLEKKMIMSKLQCDRDAYREVCNRYSMLLNDAKKKHYSDLIEQCAGDSKKLFRVVNSLCKQRQECPLPPHDNPIKLADDFGEFFCRKIDLIREEIDSIEVDPPSIEYQLPQAKLQEFSPVTVKEVHATIMRSSNATCNLDPIPTWMLKLCVDELAPIITTMVNLSLQEGYVPERWKVALVVPLLKKHDLDTTFNNFRPVSNLSFVSKSAEKLVIQQLFEHCSENAPLPTNQSSYRKYHSTETCLLRVQNDILMNMDKQEVTLLVLLDLSAAFDTINHETMKTILANDFGIVGNALDWISSFLSGRYQRVLIHQACSRNFEVNCGVSQGSCLGPVLFLLYASRLFQVIKKHLPTAHGYADDTQLYISFRPDSSMAEGFAIQSLENAITDVRAWFVSHKLKINDSKTEFIIIGSRQQLSKVNIDSVKVGSSDIKPLKTVRHVK